MKRFVSLVLALSMVLSLFPAAFAADSLSDIKGSKYEAAVDALMELGVVSGYPDGTYLPDNVLLRSELTKLLVTSYGLDLAAKSSMGVTPYEDVNSVGNHWASGYINVSADYKFVNGYPDGSFKPDNPVTYAEAITMCLRVLGYANEIESRGTWPTNYIAKAQDLKLMKDISFNSYDDGAKRGDVAILIWNMLRTKMWTVNSESEGDGLISSPDELMLNVKFKDFEYRDDVHFDSFEVATDKKTDEPIVKIDLKDEDDNKVVFDGYTYDKNDFYTYVPTEAVEVLVNTEDEVILTMVPTGDDKLVDGVKEDIDEDYEEFDGGEYDYAYGIVSQKDIAEATLLVANSEYITDVKETSKGVKLNKTTYNDKDYDDVLVIAGDDRISLKDVEEGDVLSTVEVYYGKVESSADATFYVVQSSTVDGELSKYVDETAKVTIEGDDYALADGATYIIDPESDSEKDKVFATGTADFSKMKGEEVTAVLDFLGRVVRIEFDGALGDAESDYKLFVATSDIEKEGRVYSISVIDEDENEETYDFKSYSVCKDVYDNDTNEGVEGRLVMIKLTDDKISDFTLISYDLEGVEFNASLEDNDDFKFKTYAASDYDDGVLKVWNSDTTMVAPADAELEVRKTTTVVSVVRDDNDSDDYDDDTFTTTFDAGEEVLKSIEGKILVITDAENGRVKYIVRLDDSATTSEKKVMKVDSDSKNLLGKDGETELDEPDEGTVYYMADENEKAIADYAYGVMVYTLKSATRKGEDILKVKFQAGLKLSEIKGLADLPLDLRIEKIDDDGYVLYYGGETVLALGDEASQKQEDKYEDYMFVLIDVDTDADNEDYVTAVDYATYAEVLEDQTFFPVDGVVKVDEDNKVMYIVDGFDVDETPHTVDTITFKIGGEEKTSYTYTYGESAKTLTIEAEASSSLGEELSSTEKKVELSLKSGSEDYAELAEGVLTPKKNGTVKIEGTTTTGEKAELEVVIENYDITTITVSVASADSSKIKETNKYNPSDADTIQFEAATDPDNGRKSEVKWSVDTASLSDNKSNVSIDETSGLLTVTSSKPTSGSCKIKAKIGNTEGEFELSFDA